MAEAEPSGSPELDAARIVETLERHGVAYVIVGGMAGRLHGATRVTYDLDVLAERGLANLDRLAAALKELGAFLRVGGLDDETAKALPTRLDGRALLAMETSTWRTEAGDLDVLSNLRDADGGRVAYGDLSGRATESSVGGIGVRVADLPDIIDAKRFADRAKDHDALPELESLREGDPDAPKNDVTP